MENPIVDICFYHDLIFIFIDSNFSIKMSQKSCQIPTKAIKFYMNVYELPCENMVIIGINCVKSLL